MIAALLNEVDPSNVTTVNSRECMPGLVFMPKQNELCLVTRLASQNEEINFTVLSGDRIFRSYPIKGSNVLVLQIAPADRLVVSLKDVPKPAAQIASAIGCIAARSTGLALCVEYFNRSDFPISSTDYIDLTILRQEDTQGSFHEHLWFDKWSIGVRRSETKIVPVVSKV